MRRGERHDYLDTSVAARQRTIMNSKLRDLLAFLEAKGTKVDYHNLRVECRDRGDGASVYPYLRASV